ncbi:methylenetetrahydrofolate reductase [Ruegeria sp. 2012CJ41-6]|uniref:Methylenetetrahydrofolate reductase n=1 Tax=Ruegeria spongiae TaxID=2942209 RepID=A0ABT0Q7V8_9RHOB|nr:methylenetetrahydrofolate reductase [Ruegeria spongiae]MCL6285968.1 methylenetetrahydrofolate reductase [Ruegeria spongiae]
MTNVTAIESTPNALGLICGDISIELSPEMVEKFEPDPESFPLGSKVFLTHITGKDTRIQVATAKRLKTMGYVPVVHMGARNFETDDGYVKLVEAHSKNGITHGLFLGGNPLKHKGPFHEALDLLNHSVLRNSSFSYAFIGGYPEGHPDINAEALDDSRKQKIERCRATELKPEIISQFAFDGQAMANWANRLSAENPDVPIRLGLAGVTSLPKLIKFAFMCGVGPSIAVLKKNSGGLMKVMSDRDPGDVIEQIEKKYHGESQLNLHFFPFGGWKKTLDWASNQRGD